MWYARIKKIIFAVAGIRKYRIGTLLNLLFMKLSGREMIKTGKCNCCGACCRNINLKIEGDWLKSERAFRKIAESMPEYKRFMITGVDEHGYLTFRCSCQQEDLMCGDYENRPDICRAFPEKSLVLCGGSVPETCGFTIKVGVPFAKRLEQAVKRNEK